MEPNIIGYHTNSKDKSVDFRTKSILLVSEDKEYLGTGMYFWDNLSNAEYWVRKKLKDYSVVQISKANILIEPILDLTDKEEINYIRDLWIKYCDKLGVERKNQLLGTILDSLRIFFEELDVIKVTKCHGDYSHYEMNKFLTSTGWNLKHKIDDRPKTIYAVRDISRIVDPQFVKEETKR